MDKTAIELPKRHVKNTGSYAVNVKLHGDIAATVNFEVVAAEGFKHVTAALISPTTTAARSRSLA